jgi:hypothetical protein
VRNLTLLTFLAFIAFGSVMMTGCSKGNAGPAGPAGPDSVTYTNWAPLSTPQVGTDTVTSDPDYGDPIFGQTITAQSITEDIINKGVILSYLQLIYTNPTDTLIVNAELYFNEGFSVGQINIVSYDQDFTGTNFRYVTIPGTIATTKFPGYTLQQLKAINYKTLTKTLNIPSTGASAKSF